MISTSSVYIQQELIDEERPYVSLNPVSFGSVRCEFAPKNADERAFLLLPNDPDRSWLGKRPKASISAFTRACGLS